MHLVEHETALAGTPSAFEISWSRCGCTDVGDDHGAGRVTLDAFVGDDMLLGVPVPGA